MRVEFRQGIVSHAKNNLGDQIFLTSVVGGVQLNAVNKPLTVTIAHRNTNYLHLEVADLLAWPGPFLAGTRYFLFIDLDRNTAQRTFGSTTKKPVFSFTPPPLSEPSPTVLPPGSPPLNIVGAIVGASGTGGFIVIGDHTGVYTPGVTVVVQLSPANNGIYTVASSSYNIGTNETTILVNEAVTSAAAGGTINKAFADFPILVDGRHWFDITNFRHYVREFGAWREILRVFVGSVFNSTFTSESIDAPLFTGTQIGILQSNASGRILFDESGNAIRRGDGTFITTEDDLFTNAARVDAIRLESNVAVLQNTDSAAVAAFQVIAVKSGGAQDGTFRTAQYEDTGLTVLGLLTEDTLINDYGGVVIQGVVTNPNWNWSVAGIPLWVDNGALVEDDPHVINNILHPVGQVPTARVLSRDTVVFEQGLGGKGDTGPPGSVIVTCTPATTTTLGCVTLTVPPTNPSLPIVAEDNDPRLSDARVPLAHIHPATDITFLPCGGVSSLNVQGAICELDAEKLSLTGGTLSGFLTLHANPVNPFHAATKQYVDALIAGLIWLDPIEYPNLISDALSTPPVSPLFGDVYIVAAPGLGAWATLDGRVVEWDGSAWLDRGLLSGYPAGSRFGISMDTVTVAGGTFVANDNNIFELVNPAGPTWAVANVPVDGNAVFVNNLASVLGFFQYAYHTTIPTRWVQFGGMSPIIPGLNLQFVGNTLNVFAAGTNTQIQFNDGGVLGADSDFTWNKTTNTLTVNGDIDITGSELRFYEDAVNGINYVGFQAPAAITTNRIWTLPAADGTVGQAITTDGAGNLAFTTIAAGQTSIQFQDEGAPLGSSGTVDTLNFTGTGVTATRIGNTVTVNASGGGGTCIQDADADTFVCVELTPDSDTIRIASGDTVNGVASPNLLVANTAGFFVTLPYVAAGGGSIELFAGGCGSPACTGGNVHLVGGDADAGVGGNVTLESGNSVTGSALSTVNFITYGGPLIQNSNVIPATSKQFILYVETLDDTPTEMFLDGTGGTRSMELQDNESWVFEAFVVGRVNEDSETGGYSFRGVIRKDINANIIGTPIKEVLGEEIVAWDANIDANSNYLRIQVTGDYATEIFWSAFVRVVSVIVSSGA